MLIPIDSASRMAINYAGPAGSFQTVSFADVVNGRVSAPSFKNKIVLFGATAAGAKETDTRLTPYGEMPRVEITANALSSILSRSYLARARGNDVLAALIAFGVVAGLLLAQARPASIALSALVLAVLYFVTAWCLLTFTHFIAPVLPVLGVLLATTVLAIVVEQVFAAQQHPVRKTGLTV